MGAIPAPACVHSFHVRQCDYFTVTAFSREPEMLSAHFNEPVISPQFFSLSLYFFFDSFLSCCEPHVFGRPREHRDFKCHLALMKIHCLPLLKFSNIASFWFNRVTNTVYKFCICVLRKKNNWT